MFPMLTRLVWRAFQGTPGRALFQTRPPDAREIAELESLLADWKAREKSKGRP